MKKSRKRYVKLLLLLCLGTMFLSGCGEKDNNTQQTEEPTNIIIESEITESLKNDAGIKFDRITDLTYEKVEVNEEDMEALKTKYASQVPFVKYESTFSLVSVEMDMNGNYSSVFVFNNGEWQLSFGYITDDESWEYFEKEASRVDKQRMLDDLKEQEFGTFQKGFVGDAKNSSIGSIESREYDETIHRDIINTSVSIKTDFAQYSIPVQFTYYFQKGEWELGGTEIAEVEDWKLTYNDGKTPTYLSDNAIISYLTDSSSFLTYVCNLDYVNNYKITKDSEIASKDKVIVNYIFTVDYEYIGTVDYNVELTYDWLNNEWSEPQPVPSIKSADFSEMLERIWSNDDNTSFKFTSVEESEDSSVVKLVGKYINENDSTDIITNISVMLRDNNWDGNITDINGNQIWDLPSSVFTLNLEYGAIVYNDKYYSPVEINIIDDEPVEEDIITSNVLDYEQEDATYKNQITRDNLFVDGLAVTYVDGTFTLSGNVKNLSDGQSAWDIRMAMFDKDDYIVAEGSTNSGDSSLLSQSAAIFKIDVDDLTEEDKEKIDKIIIYIKAE